MRERYSGARRGALMALALAMVALLVLAGCGGGGNETSGKFTLMNNGAADFDEIYITPSDDDYWGDSLISRPLKLMGDTELEITPTDDMEFDMKIVDAYENTITFDYMPLENVKKLNVSSVNNVYTAIVMDGSDKELAKVEGTVEWGKAAQEQEDEPEDPEETEPIETEPIATGLPPEEDEEEEGWIEFNLLNETPYILDDVRIYGFYDPDEGYNHIEAIGTLEVDQSTGIGVDLAKNYIVAVGDEEGNVLEFSGVLLYEGSFVSILWDGETTPSLMVETQDGEVAYFDGEQTL